jgi:hypothetical protein
MSESEVLAALEESPIHFKAGWDEVKKESR